ncbi:DgyrCDS2811 [Dimorphilus gyrociliatus]|uniref:DgyrCDS2811 n=1 Tax=Dimorphilus gyrociliatus TaxID=2664684 RepID=A0A7I8VDB4_9ANNE|nr:DgyrCDS2811 [Dimorphilus gyrociliatus]
MAKRTAEKDLNRDNWDQDEEKEEAGVFKRAADSELQKRVIKHAKRSNLGAEKPTGLFKSVSLINSDDSSKEKLFEFGKNTSSAANFTFAFNDPKKSTPDVTPTTTAPDVTSDIRNPPDVAKESLSIKQLPDVAMESSGSSNNETAELKAAIRELNSSFKKWIEQQLKEDELINIAPSCQSYIDHIAKLKSKYSEFSKIFVENGGSLPNGGKNSFSFNKPEKEKKAAEGPKLTFHIKDCDTKTPFSNLKPVDTSTFKFGPTSSTTDKTPQTSKNDNEEDYVPPEPEKKVLAEEGSKFSVKVKMYFMIEKTWMDRGTGMAFLKPLENSAQLIVRAENTLGTIMLNNVLKKELKMTKSGDKAFSFVTVPNPPVEPKNPEKAFPILLRVKTKELRDEFLKNIDEMKNTE